MVADGYMMAQLVYKVLLSSGEAAGIRFQDLFPEQSGWNALQDGLMDHNEVGRYWNENAEAWTELARAGYDHYRDGLNTPAFLVMLPDIQSLSGLDVGCGEGYNTRLLAEKGARVTGIDISETFIRHAKEAEDARPLGIDYRLASAVELPFESAGFDFVTAFMSLMDIPETKRVLAEVFRVLRPGGFFQFSITHPCFDTPHRRNLRDESGYTYAIEVGDYFVGREGEVKEWLFFAAHRRYAIGYLLSGLPFSCGP
jgi:2-polyprenyl-3-methyl-5-hydroxy-6-metoxy-1,4-benzoquinol methylase